MTWVKICGHRTAESALAAAEAGADAVGFIFVRGQRRYVEPGAAGEIARALPARLERIGVFVDEAVDEIVRIYAAAGLSGVQLHGAEGPDVVAELRRRLGPGARVIKAWRVRPPGPGGGGPDGSPGGGSGPDRPPPIGDYPPGPHLVEGFQAGSLGGSGRAWDWGRLAVLARAHPGRPFVLAGGLNPANVAVAIATVRPWGVDVSSGVERDGQKDPELIRAFVRAARAPAPPRKEETP